MDTPRVVLVSDVVDSTAAHGRAGDPRMAAAWAEHDRRARALMARWRAIEVGRSDGFLLLFDAVDDAVGYALDYHRAAAALDVPLPARVGIHAGPVRLRANPPEVRDRGATPFEVDGLAVPVAARVAGAARAGQTLLSADARRGLDGAAWRCVSHGHWRLKGVPEPTELFEVGAAADDAAPFMPPADSEKAWRVVPRDGTWMPARELPHSLPAERDAFVGRADMLQAIAALFDAGVRLVTVAGVGGIGKTRLALRHARTWLGDYPGGGWFCDLSSARGLDGLLHAVARGLGVALGRADPVQQLGAAIAGRGRCLVVLDNFEQLAPLAAATLGAWLEAAAEARFVVTSRELLGLGGEHVLALEPMSADDALAMFRLRARAAGVRGEFGRDDEAALGPLIDLLDRLPLAIELAAARGRVMSPGTMLRRMGDRFALLASRGGRADRQSTMRATLDWSWELLSPVEQAALAQLSVFEGGCTLGAAEAVLDLSAYRGAPEVVNVVQALVEKSLVRVSAGHRFELLRTVQDYAAGRLAGAAAVKRRHAAHHAGLWPGAGAAELGAELDNLVAAARRAAAAGWPAEASGALMGAWSVLSLRGPFGAILPLAEAVEATPGLGAAGLAHVDWVAGWALDSSGRAAEARARYERALLRAGEAGDGHALRRVLVLLGNLLAHAGPPAAAHARLEQALALAQAAGDPQVVCEAETGLGNQCQTQGLLLEALAHHRRALAAAREAGDRRWEGGVLGNLGVLQSNRGETAEAERCYEEALAIARDLGDRRWEGNTLCNLALLHHVTGRLEPARAGLESALQLARTLGHPRLESVAWCNLGIVVEALGDAGRACACFESALAVAERLGDARAQGQVLGYQGVLLARLGRHDDGRARLLQGQALLEAAADELSLAMLLAARAECELLAGDAAACDALLARADALGERAGTRPESELGVAIARVRALQPRVSPTGC